MGGWPIGWRHTAPILERLLVRGRRFPEPGYSRSGMSVRGPVFRADAFLVLRPSAEPTELASARVLGGKFERSITRETCIIIYCAFIAIHCKQTCFFGNYAFCGD